MYLVPGGGVTYWRRVSLHTRGALDGESHVEIKKWQSPLSLFLLFSYQFSHVEVRNGLCHVTNIFPS